jgi:NAD(P)-dependent dehydrogenase (short-subunit alcohol dehydrogenase family)
MHLPPINGDLMSDGKRASDTPWLGLSGLVCVVTGGGSGIGAETARQFAAAGASVAILDLNRENAVSVAADIEAKEEAS